MPGEIVGEVGAETIRAKTGRIIATISRIKILLRGLKLFHHGDEAFRRLLAEKETGPIFYYRLKRTALPVRQHGSSRSLRFQRRNAEIFYAGKDQGPAAAIMVPQDRLRL